MGAFTLLDADTMLASPVCSSPFPNGEFDFVEDKEGPPSRAYRKLWEALVIAGQLPVPRRDLRGRRRLSGRLDLGPRGISGPKSWRSTARIWTLASPPSTLSARFATTPLLSGPSRSAPVDWLCSDVICYPPALLEWADAWLESGLASNFVCTIKMQGASFDKASADRFAAIPGSRVLHLWHNRHELTWINLGA